jgi:hypothetical protein
LNVFSQASESIATQLFGAPDPNKVSSPVIWRVMLASVVPAGSAVTTVCAV